MKLTQNEIAALAQEEKNRPLVEMYQRLSTARGFYLYWFETIPDYPTRTECFQAANDLHFELFGEYKYSDISSFNRAKQRFTK